MYEYEEEAVEDYIERMITIADIDQWYAGVETQHLMLLMQECNIGGVNITGHKSHPIGHPPVIPLTIEII